MIAYFRQLPRAILFLLVACIMLSLSLLLISAKQSDFYLISSLYGLAFICYYLIITQVNLNQSFIKWALVAAVAIRLLAIFIFPQLSDDIYRFIWDGRLILNGYSPYTMLPSEAINHHISGIDDGLYQKLNSQNYYSVYPPITQLIFMAGAWAKSVYWSSFIYKAALFTAEMGSITLLYKMIKKYQLKSQSILIYALNPLIIIEIMGNLHFEGFMIITVLASWYYLADKKDWLAGAAIAVGAGFKLIPLLFTPIYWALRQKSKVLFIVTAMLTALIFLPVFFTLMNFGSSVDLYFGKFEFNASIYYLLRALGDYFTGYNLIRYIGILPILLLIAVGLKYLFHKDRWNLSVANIANGVLLSYSCYLFTTTTVHPWYLSILILCSVFSTFRYAILWSGLIILSYSHYDSGTFTEKYLLISIEYILVFGFLAYEYFLQQKRFLPS